MYHSILDPKIDFWDFKSGISRFVLLIQCISTLQSRQTTVNHVFSCLENVLELNFNFDLFSHILTLVHTFVSRNCDETNIRPPCRSVTTKLSYVTMFETSLSEIQTWSAFQQIEHSKIQYLNRWNHSILDSKIDFWDSKSGIFRFYFSHNVYLPHRAAKRPPNMYLVAQKQFQR